MTDEELALSNIAACREALKAFEPIAPYQLMLELTQAVDRHEHAVREFHKLPPQ